MTTHYLDEFGMRMLDIWWDGIPVGDYFTIAIYCQNDDSAGLQSDLAVLEALGRFPGDNISSADTHGPLTIGYYGYRFFPRDAVVARLSLGWIESMSEPGQDNPAGNATRPPDDSPPRGTKGGKGN